MKYLLTTILFIAALQGKSQTQSVEAIDQFYEAWSRADVAAMSDFLTEDAKTRSISYTESGASQINTFNQIEFLSVVKSQQEGFKILHNPIVLVQREYGQLATYQVSIMTEIIDREQLDTLRSRALHSLVLVQLNGLWNITTLTLQNEPLSATFDESLWPKELTGAYKLGYHEYNADLSYNPKRVFEIEEVAEPPLYPGGDITLNALAKSFAVSTTAAENTTPFNLIIGEDGIAVYDPKNQLSGALSQQVKLFAESMVSWYPAIAEKASVKCRITFHIKSK